MSIHSFTDHHQRSSLSIREHNQQQILVAAEQEFVLKGFRGATMQGIADRAGLPKANVHYYFKSKKNLIIENSREQFEVLLEKLFD